MALTDNLIAYWKLDESSGNAADATGNGRTLTNNNGITYTTGKINNAASLARGSSQYFTGTAAALFPTGDQSYQFWVNPNTAAGARFLMWNTYSGSTGLITSLENSTGLKLRIAIYNSGGNKDFQSTVNISASTYTHIVLVYTAASGQWEIYVNGSLVHTETGFPTSVTAKSTAYFGIDGGLSSTNYYDGKVDEMGLWGRALTSAEVTSLYNGGAGSAYPFSTPVTVNATTLSCTFTIPAYSVSTVRVVSVSPTTLSASFSIPTYVVGTGATVQATTLSATFSIPTYDVEAGDVAITPTTLSATFSIPAYTVTPEIYVTVTPATLSATFSIPSYSVEINAGGAPSTLSATFTIPAYTVLAQRHVEVTPTVLSATFSVPAYAVGMGVTVQVSTLVATFAIPSTTVTPIANVTITATVLVATFSLPTLDFVGGVWRKVRQPTDEWDKMPIGE